MTTPFLIAITGGSGSGKSTLANTLVDRMGQDKALLFTEDAYYQPREFHGPDAPLWSEEEMEQKVDFDDPTSKDLDLFEAQLAALKRGESVLQPHYDFATHDRIMGKEVQLDPKPVIIAEGVHVLCRPQLFSLFDLTVFVDTPPDLRLARRILRDVHERKRDMDRVIRQYLTYVRPAHGRHTEPAKFSCDLVIQDEGPLAMINGRPNQRAKVRLAAPVWAFLKDEGLA